MLRAMTRNFNNTTLSLIWLDSFGIVSYVDCPMRGNKTLGLFYGNAKEALQCFCPTTSWQIWPQSALSSANIQTLYDKVACHHLLSQEVVFRDHVLLGPKHNNMGTDRRVWLLTEYINFCRDTVFHLSIHPSAQRWAELLFKPQRNHTRTNTAQTR